jgi:uncharacterized cupredoxin-like copper-binding protein
MKQSVITLCSLLLAAVILAGCSGMTTAPMPGMNTGSSPLPPGQNATTPGKSVVTVQVTETEFTIDSSLTSFRPGIAYHFVVHNLGKTVHELMIMPKAEGAMSGMSMEEMDRLALARIDTIAPGETKTVDYTFSAAAAGSHPEFACYLPGHYKAGMKRDVSVQA